MDPIGKGLIAHSDEAKTLMLDNVKGAL